MNKYSITIDWSKVIMTWCAIAVSGFLFRIAIMMYFGK